MQSKKEPTKNNHVEEKSSSTATALKSAANNSKTAEKSITNQEESAAKQRSRAVPAQSSSFDASAATAKSKTTTAKVTIKYDVGFGNSLFIRGEGANLSWEKGLQLKNTKANEWVWETPSTFTKCEFKILVNDAHFETGPNHVITFGSTVQYTPHFPQH